MVQVPQPDLHIDAVQQDFHFFLEYASKECGYSVPEKTLYSWVTQRT